MTLPDHFGTSFLINLASRQDRLLGARNEFDKVGWKLGEACGTRIFRAIHCTDALTWPSAAVRGCFLSHYNCIKTAYDEGHESVLIFEDDISFCPEINRLLPPMMEHLSQMRWGLMFFGHEQTGDEFARAHANTAFVRLHPLNARDEFIAAHFYAVHRRAMPSLIDHLEDVLNGRQGRDFIAMPFDGALNHYRKLSRQIAFLANPKLGWQRPSRSDIAPGRLDRIPLLWPFLEKVRELKHILSRQ